jgi:hypothetical protein
MYIDVNSLCTYFDAWLIPRYHFRMSPRTTKADIKDYRPVLSIEARDALTKAAEALGFVVTRPGTYLGTPSVRELLESLAAAYERDPAGVQLALRVLGVVANPLPDDVRFHSDPDAE